MSKRKLGGVLFAIMLAGKCGPVLAANGNGLSVDFRYSPPDWQTAICLPDDPRKSLVSKQGELLYHYQKGREFGTRIAAVVDENAEWVGQDLVSPRVPIVRTRWKTPELEIVQEAFAALPATAQKTPDGKAEVPAGGEKAPTKPDKPSAEGGRPREDVVIVHIRNTGSGKRTVHPKLIVDTTRSFRVLDGRRVIVNGHDEVTASLKLGAMKQTGRFRRVFDLEALELPAGGSASFFVAYAGGGGPANSMSIEKALAERNRVNDWWLKQAPLPYGVIQVPDKNIQALVDSSIRNIWQAREIKGGLPAFQVGPTCYRGLWIVDGAFLLETVTMLGAGDEARSGVAYELLNQKDDGRIEVLRAYHKENGIVLWTCVRHARLTRDKVWLESVWPKLERIAEYIRKLRRATLENDVSLDDGLMPEGFADGGIGGRKFEYTNSYWNLAGLRAFIDGARWLGKTKEAEMWQAEHDDFMAAFRKGAKRDMKSDPHGNRYLPIRMDGGDLPQRAQWAFCHAVYPGQIFPVNDPLVLGNMKMLEATEREGMVYGTGWDAHGIWNYFASFYGHAWLWMGHGRKAAEVLYAFANHAAPVLDWREEQSLKGTPYKKVGDMPHNWASAEFIRLTAHLLALDRGDELHLFEGLPSQWCRAGMTTRLDGLVTPFGPVSLDLTVAADGRTARLAIQSIQDPACRRVLVHLGTWTSAAEDAVLKLDPREAHELEIPVR